MEMTPEREEAIIKRLQAQPELQAQVEGLVDEVENRTGELNTADEAEEAMVGRVRAMGRAALNRWAQQRCAQLNAVAPRPACKDGEKTLVADGVWPSGDRGAGLASRHAPLAPVS
jgi:hypothetical protein